MTKYRTVAALAFAAVLPAAAFADEPREQVLEKKVAELERRLAEVETQRGGYFTATSDLEARISELERASLDNKGGMNVLWKNGLRTESDDKAFTFQVYGRIQNDWTFWDVDGDTEAALGEDDINGGTEFRRVRLGAQGTMYGNVKWKSEIDFADSEVEFADVYMELVNCSFGAVRVGHFDEPFGLDRLTSSRFTTFMERNLIAEAFAPQRNTGVMLHGNALDDRLTYQFGMFRDADGAGNDVDNASSGEYNFTGRVAGRPLVEDDGATYLHLGGALSYRDFSDDEARFRARPHVHLGPRFVDTGTIDAEDGMLAGAEVAFVTGPFKVQGEYARASGNGASGADDFDFDAWAFEASYWLTGEGTAYDKGKAAFDRPKVKSNYGDGEGTGAWQVALGFDTIDLGDASYEGGDMDTIRLGVSWWLNPNTRVSMNIVDVDRDDLDDGDARALEFRFQVDF
jgi:phosphate-selective porin OprO/OprP